MTEPVYYLFYDLGTAHTFHTPLYEDKIDVYAKQHGLQIVSLDGPLVTFGEDVDELVSVQFVRKVIAALKDNTARLADDIPINDAFTESTADTKQQENKQPAQEADNQPDSNNISNPDQTEPQT